MVKLKLFEGQLLTSNDTVFYKVYENSSSNKTRDTLRFLSSLGRMKAEATLGGAIKFTFLPSPTRHNAPPRASLAAANAFSKLMAEDIKELVEESIQAGHSLDEFREAVRRSEAQVSLQHGIHFYRSLGLRVVLRNSELFYEQ